MSRNIPNIYKMICWYY